MKKKHTSNNSDQYNKAAVAGLLVLITGALYLVSNVDAVTKKPLTLNPVVAEDTVAGTVFFSGAESNDGGELVYNWDGEVSCGKFITSGDTAQWIKDDETCGSRVSGVITLNIRHATTKVSAQCNYYGVKRGTGESCRIVSDPNGIFAAKKPAPASSVTTQDKQDFLTQQPIDENQQVLSIIQSEDQTTVEETSDNSFIGWISSLNDQQKITYSAILLVIILAVVTIVRIASSGTHARHTTHRKHMSKVRKTIKRVS